MLSVNCCCVLSSTQINRQNTNASVRKLVCESGRNSKMLTPQESKRAGAKWEFSNRKMVSFLVCCLIAFFPLSSHKSRCIPEQREADWWGRLPCLLQSLLWINIFFFSAKANCFPYFLESNKQYGSDQTVMLGQLFKSETIGTMQTRPLCHEEKE